jgi:AbrB family looped-hinge helix DNA binding protein
MCIDSTIVVRYATGDPVTTVTISPKFQVVIPREIREALALEPGQKMQAFALDGRVAFVPVKPAKALRGFVRGISTDVPREGDRV